MLNVSDSINFLKINGLPVIKTVKVDSVNGLGMACDGLGYPLVMKLDTGEHKTEKGWVVKGVESFNQALTVFNKLSKNGEVIVQPQASGLELSLGIKKDPVFGQVIMFGLGGIFIELFKDVVFRVCPINKAEAKTMINELKSIELLKGFRGGQKVDLDSLAELIVLLSKISVDKDIKALDINPLMATDKGLLIVDARLEI